MAAPLRKLIFRSSPSCTRLHTISTLRSRSSQSAESAQNGNAEFTSQTHFGFETVNEREKEQKVHEVFESVASNYDLMNDAMSVGVHRLWKDHFMEQFSPAPGTKLLDVAGGTGDIALRFLKYVKSPRSRPLPGDTEIKIPREVTAQVYVDPSETSSSSSESDCDGETLGQRSSSHHTLKTDGAGSHVTVCDINQAMLDMGMKKAEGLGYTQGIDWVRGNAESLSLPDNTYDAYTIAFGIRNCTHVDLVLEEAYRVLKLGGRFMCLEFSHVPNPILSKVYDRYSFEVIPVLGKVLAGDWKSYQYLVESIRQFPDQDTFAAMIRGAGFRLVSHKNLTFGVAAIHTGFKI